MISVIFRVRVAVDSIGLDISIRLTRLQVYSSNGCSVDCGVHTDTYVRFCIRTPWDTILDQA